VRFLVAVIALAGCSAENAARRELPAPAAWSEPYVYVLGQVEHPGRYQLVAPTTLTQVLAWARLTPLSWQPTVTRTTWDGRRVKVRLALRAIEEGDAPDVWLFPGDVVYVDERTY